MEDYTGKKFDILQGGDGTPFEENDNFSQTESSEKTWEQTQKGNSEEYTSIRKEYAENTEDNQPNIELLKEFLKETPHAETESNNSIPFHSSHNTFDKETDTTRLAA